ncbi:MAG: alanine--tRNA ligase, partial [Methanosarcinales archaeon]|nr:alanine--tRNA ligase [Methanosarcinales archaeon]
VPANQPSEGMIKGKPYVKMDNYIVDTGYGLERFVWASKGSPTIYDAVMPGIVNNLMEIAGIDHSLDDPEYAQILSQNARFAGLMDVSGSSNLMALRKQVAESIGIDVDRLQKIIEPVEAVYQIADHTRCLAFMLGDGIIPSNAKAGYLARLVIRRTLRRMKELGLSESISDLVALQIQDMSYYPEFAKKMPIISEILDNEEVKYGETLTRGTRFVEKMAQYYKKEQQPIPTDKLVELYDSHGIPPEISKEVANELGVEVDLPDNFYSIVADSHMSAQETDVNVHPFADRIAQLPKTKCMYYEEPTRMEFEAVVLDVFENYIVLDQTLFYPEGGGQGSDRGTFSTED